MGGSTVAKNLETPILRTIKPGLEKTTSGVDAKDKKTVTSGREEMIDKESTFPTYDHHDNGTMKITRMDTNCDGTS